MKECDELKILHNKLLESRVHSITNKGTRVKVSKEQGVYIIYSPEGKVLHVGTTKTAKGGLDQRLNNHRRGQSSFAKKYLMPKGLVLNDKFKFKFFEVKNSRTRVLLEALTIGLLCPEHIGTGVKVE